MRNVGKTVEIGENILVEKMIIGEQIAQYQVDKKANFINCSVELIDAENNIAQTQSYYFEGVNTGYVTESFIWQLIDEGREKVS